MPVVPLFEAVLGHGQPAAAAIAAASVEPASRLEPAAELTPAALVGLPAGPPTGSPVLPLADVNAFLAEQRRSAGEVFGSVMSGLPAAAGSAAEDCGNLWARSHCGF